MAKYDVYRLADGLFAVDCQSDYFHRFDTRLVIPLLRPSEDAAPIAKLEPLLPLDEDRLILTTHLLAAVPTHELGPVYASVREHASEIDRALDLLITGF